MLSSIAGGCFAAALLFTSSLASSVASPVSIAFGNPTFTGINFSRPFSINWFGGDGTPATIRLVAGNPAKLQSIATIATGVTASPYVWKPVASQSIRPGQLYAFTIEQSGLTNYSPLFNIGMLAEEYAQLQAQYRAPVRVGSGHYYPLENRAVQDDARGLNSDFGLFPRTEGIFPRTEGIFPRTEGIFRRTYATTPTGSALTFAYATGTPTGSDILLAYATGTSTGSAGSLRGAAKVSSSPIPYANAAQRLSLGALIVKLGSVGYILLLLWI